MSEEPKKQKRSRPKSEVVKSSDINKEGADKKKHSSRSKTAEDGEAKKSHTKRSHRSEKPATEDRSAEIEQLKKDLEAANSRVATLQEENQSLTNKVNAKKEESSSSSADNNQAEEISSLKAQLEDRNNTCAEQERTIDSLRNEISTLRADHDKALEAEFEKLAAAQKEIKALQEKNEELQKPKPIQGAKVATQPTPNTAQTSSAPNSALSPRGQAAQGNIPAWKQRELEKQKEAEEARQAESRAKLQKVASLRSTKNDIHTDTEHSRNFRDPLDNKANTTHGGVIESSTIETESISPALTADLTQEEKAELEMARLAKTLKRGGHSI